MKLRSCQEPRVVEVPVETGLGEVTEALDRTMAVTVRKACKVVLDCISLAVVARAKLVWTTLVEM